MNNIALKLKQLRIKAKLTKKQLADYLKLDESFITLFEEGHTKINISTIYKLSTLYCVPFLNIIDDDKEAKSLYHIHYHYNLDNIAFVNRIILNQLEMDKIDPLIFKLNHCTLIFYHLGHNIYYRSKNSIIVVVNSHHIHIIGYYISKAKQLLDKDLISNGKYEEYLMEACRFDIVYGLNGC